MPELEQPRASAIRLGRIPPRIATADEGDKAPSTPAPAAKPAASAPKPASQPAAKPASSPAPTASPAPSAKPASSPAPDSGSSAPDASGSPETPAPSAKPSSGSPAPSAPASPSGAPRGDVGGDSDPFADMDFGDMGGDADKPEDGAGEPGGDGEQGGDTPDFSKELSDIGGTEGGDEQPAPQPADTQENPPSLPDSVFFALRDDLARIQKSAKDVDADVKEYYRNSAKAVLQTYVNQLSPAQRKELNKLPKI